MTAGKNARGLRVRLQMREIRRGIEVVRDGNVDIAEVAGKSFLVRLLHHLRDPGGAVIIATDAAWGSHHSRRLHASVRGICIADVCFRHSAFGAA